MYCNISIYLQEKVHASSDALESALNKNPDAGKRDMARQQEHWELMAKRKGTDVATREAAATVAMLRVTHGGSSGARGATPNIAK